MERRKMTDAELFETFADLRILASNILGFHVLAADETASEIGRIMAQSQSILARMIWRTRFAG